MLVEHPDMPGVFYDPGLVYIHTGDPIADAEYAANRAAETYSLPQTLVIGTIAVSVNAQAEFIASITKDTPRAEPSTREFVWVCVK